MFLLVGNLMLARYTTAPRGLGLRGAGVVVPKNYFRAGVFS